MMGNVLQRMLNKSVHPGEFKEAHWGFADILRIFGLYIAGLIVSHILLSRSPEIAVTVSRLVALSLVLVVHNKAKFWPNADYFGVCWSSFRVHLKGGVLWGLVAKVAPIVVMMLVLIPFVILVGDSMPEINLQPNHDTASFAPFSLAWALATFGLVIWAPVIEEVFTRGILYGYLRKKWGVRVGILVSSLVFALLHGLGWILVPTFVAGLIFAMLYEHTGSLAPGIIAHATFNLVAVIFSSL